MLVLAVAALEALFYLYHLPLHLAFRMVWRDGLRFGAGFSAVDAGVARRRADAALRRGRRKRSAGPDRRFTWGLLRRLRFDAVRVEGTLALGDAAATAVGCGALTALLAGLGCGAPRLTLNVRPDFGGGLSAALRGMVTARAGHIIAAAAGSGMARIRRSGAAGPGGILRFPARRAARPSSGG